MHNDGVYDIYLIYVRIVIFVFNSKSNFYENIIGS